MRIGVVLDERRWVARMQSRAKEVRAIVIHVLHALSVKGD